MDMGNGDMKQDPITLSCDDFRLEAGKIRLFRNSEQVGLYIVEEVMGVQLQEMRDHEESHWYTLGWNIRVDFKNSRSYDIQFWNKDEPVARRCFAELMEMMM